MAKFGIALEWGSRGPEFESQHSDQAGADVVHLLQLFFVTVGAGSACGPAVPNRTDAAGPGWSLCSVLMRIYFERARAGMDFLSL